MSDFFKALLEAQELGSLAQFARTNTSAPNLRTVTGNHATDPKVVRKKSTVRSRSELLQASDEDFFTAEEATLYTKLSIKTLYNRKSQGRLRGHNVGGRKKGKLVFKKSDLDRFIFGRGGN